MSEKSHFILSGEKWQKKYISLMREEENLKHNSTLLLSFKKISYGCMRFSSAIFSHSLHEVAMWWFKVFLFPLNLMPRII